jgi:DNA-binding CsgD family transcriptional regulator
VGGITIIEVSMVGSLERDSELSQLAALLATARNGRGQVCVIEGPSGIGKSRLLEDCAQLASEAEMSVLRTRGSELTRDYAFGIARNLFEPTLMRVAPDVRSRLLHGPAALAGPVVGDGEASDEFSVLHGLYWLTVNLAEERPLAIFIDDVQWADESSLRFLVYVAQRLDDVSVALVVAIRSEDPSAASSVIGHLLDAASTPPIRPAELTEPAVQALLAAALPDRDVDASLARSVTRDTGGNPFLVVAVANAIRAGEDTHLNTPHSVRRHITRRLGLLESAAGDLAKAASVLGEDGALRTATRLAGLDPDPGITAAEQLVAAQILASSDPITFAHPIIRTAIYSGLAPGERPATHFRAARLLVDDGAQPEVIAEHLLHAAPTSDTWVLAVLHEAGRAAARKGAPAAAARYLRRAVYSVDLDQLPPAVLIDLGLAEAAAGEATSLDRFEQALELVSEPIGRADALYSLGQTLYRFGRYADASTAFRRGAKLFEVGDQQLRRRFEGAAWGAEYYLKPAQRGTVSVVDGDGPGDRAILAVQALHESLTAAPASAAADLAVRALGEGALLAEQTSQGIAVNLAILALLHAGRVVEAHAAADAAVRDARKRGAVLAYAEASLVRALVLYTRGRVTDAAVDAQVAVDGMQRGWHALAPTALATLVHCMIERDELKEAASLITSAQSELAPPEAAGINAYIYVARGRVHLRCGEIDAAREDLVAAEEALRQYGALNPAMLPWRSLAGLIAHAAGDEYRAQELIDEEIRLARLFDVPIPLGVALRRRAITEASADAVESLRAAVDVLESTEARLEYARAVGDLGRSLRHAGHRIEARDRLNSALGLAHRCGATRLEAEIREELFAAGARPRRTAVSGIESLTPAELRAARLAADGMSNREIAVLTFVSRNTIAWHLKNIYRKLDVESREQLTMRLREEAIRTESEAL